ncbi:MAG TPA: hypothetical protein VK970_24615 [Candidatus Methylacidiphilales bacterium]|nr:hypothetical protein [Candidatus Methylacidiphilales bacterium]
MSEKSPRPNYYLEFLKSPAHAWIALGTLGVGFASPDTLGIGLMVGAAAYALAWIYIPDLSLFKNRIDKLRQAVDLEAARHNGQLIAQARSRLESQLVPSGRQRYAAFSYICTEIQQALHVQEREQGGMSTSEVAPLLDEFRMGFLKLLTAEQRLGLYLDRENPQELESTLAEVHQTITRVEEELARRRESGNFNSLATEERLLESKREHAEVLEARKERLREANANLSLIQSELNRLTDRVKLMRADTLAQSLDSKSVTSSLESTLEQMLQANRWLADIDNSMPSGSFSAAGMGPAPSATYSSGKYTASGRLVMPPVPPAPPQREFGSLETPRPAATYTNYPPPVQPAPPRQKQRE